MERAAQQSWAAWILDAYANAIITSHEDLTDDSFYDSMSSTPSDTDNTSSPSPYGPYVRTGRGGAGNFTWQSQHNRDPEGLTLSFKEKRTISLELEHIDTLAAMKKSQARRTVTCPRIGRGGAGNVVFSQSNEIQRSPTATSFAKSPLSITSSPIMYSGRGGAGNFNATKSASDSARLAKEQQERADAAKRREQAEQQVQALLQAPTQAYIASRRRSLLPEDIETWT